MSGGGDDGLGRTETDQAAARANTLPSDEPRPVAAGGTPRLPTASRDDFAITSEIGRGGIGRVVRARDPLFGRTIAVKELLSDQPVARLRFLREAMITAR